MQEPDIDPGAPGRSALYSAIFRRLPRPGPLDRPLCEDANGRPAGATRMPNVDPHAAGQAMRAMPGLEAVVAQSGLEQPLLEVVRTRVSRIDGCAYRLDMHTEDARQRRGRAAPPPARRLSRTPVYTERERAARASAEALTLLAVDRGPDAAFAAARAAFSDDELVALTMAIVSINGFNRFNRALPGWTRHQPGMDLRGAVLAGS